jgi:hypothetical protein
VGTSFQLHFAKKDLVYIWSLCSDQLNSDEVGLGRIQHFLELTKLELQEYSRVESVTLRYIGPTTLIVTIVLSAKAASIDATPAWSGKILSNTIIEILIICWNGVRALKFLIALCTKACSGTQASCFIAGHITLPEWGTTTVKAMKGHYIPLEHQA